MKAHWREYLRDGRAIYAQSFATIERECDLSRFDPSMWAVARRMVHACGDVEIVPDIRNSPGAALRGAALLSNGCTVFCDVQMVVHGIIARHLARQTILSCMLDAAQNANDLQGNSTTRSAAGVFATRDAWPGQICVIGNAPTALFALLECIEDGAQAPALIVGMPVGFVGAAESKTALIDCARRHDFAYITLDGRKGGSAIASACVNAIAVKSGEARHEH